MELRLTYRAKYSFTVATLQISSPFDTQDISFSLTAEATMKQNE